EVVLNNLALTKVRHEQGASLRHANVPELSMRIPDIGRDRNLFLDLARGGVNDHCLGRIPITHDQDPIFADSLARVNLRSWWGVILPKDLLLGADHACSRHT